MVNMNQLPTRGPTNRPIKRAANRIYTQRLIVAPDCAPLVYTFEAQNQPTTNCLQYATLNS